MHIVEVGKPFYEEGETFSEGYAEFNYYMNGHELLLFFDNLRNEEIKSVEAGPLEFGLFIYESIIFLVYKFSLIQRKEKKSIVYGDAGFNINLVPENIKRIPELPRGNEHGFLHIILVDSSTGIVRALRGCTLSPKFTYKLHFEILKQQERSFNEEEHYRLAKEFYRKYSSLNLWNMCKIKCNAGD